MKIHDPSAEQRADLKRVVAHEVYAITTALARITSNLDHLLEGDLNVSARHHTHGLDEHERSTGKYWPTAPVPALARQRARWIAHDLRTVADEIEKLDALVASVPEPLT